MDKVPTQTCNQHYCDKHQRYGCKCPCDPCTKEAQQAYDDLILLKGMQEADYPNMCDPHDHSWPAELDGSTCQTCGLPYEEWCE